MKCFRPKHIHITCYLENTIAHKSCMACRQCSDDALTGHVIPHVARNFSSCSQIMHAYIVVRAGDCGRTCRLCHYKNCLAGTLMLLTRQPCNHSVLFGRHTRILAKCAVHGRLSSVEQHLQGPFMYHFRSLSNCFERTFSCNLQLVYSCRECDAKWCQTRV